MRDMAEETAIGWGNITIEFEPALFASADIEAASRAVDADQPGFSGRVPAGSLILLGKHGYSGEYFGSYQVGAGRPRTVEMKARSARNAARALLAEIAARIAAELSPLRRPDRP